MGAKREDPGDGSVGGRKGAVMAGAESPSNTCALREGEEGDDIVIWVGDGVDVYGVVIGGRVVCKRKDGLGPG